MNNPKNPLLIFNQNVLHMKIALTFLFFAVIGLSILLFYQQGEMNRMKEEYQLEKTLFDARYGEIVRLNDEIGEYKDSCFIYRKQLHDMLMELE